MDYGVSGGNYNGKKYLCMFDASAPHKNLSPNQKYYYQSGMQENNPGAGIDDEDAILAFSVDTNELMYASVIPDNDLSLSDILDKFTKERPDLFGEKVNEKRVQLAEAIVPDNENFEFDEYSK